MRHPLPTVHIRTQLADEQFVSSMGEADSLLLSAVEDVDLAGGPAPSSMGMQVAPSDGSEFPPGVRYVTLNGIRYRLVRDDPQPAAHGGEADCLPFQYFAENLDVRML